MLLSCAMPLHRLPPSLSRLGKRSICFPSWLSHYTPQPHLQRSPDLLVMFPVLPQRALPVISSGVHLSPEEDKEGCHLRLSSTIHQSLQH